MRSVSGHVVSGRDLRSGAPVAIHVENGVVSAIEPGPADTDLWLAPGLVDLQVNGYGGHDVNAADVTPATIVSLTWALAGVGVTTFLPTVITATETRITAALRAVAQARRDDPLVAHAIPMVHVEGPHVSPEDGPRGAHPAAHVRAPDIAEFRRWQAACDGLVGMVTLSPHWVGTAEYVAALVATGVRVSVGHTHAEPNPIWTQLADDRLTKTFIADGHHLPRDTLKSLLRAAGLDRSVLVSDVTALGGMPPGIYDQPIGGRVELRADGRLGGVGTTFLAGAARPLMTGIETVLNEVGLDLADAFALATCNPGRAVGGRGTIAVGASADLIAFRWRHGGRVELESVLAQGVEMLRP